jgi:ornithine cyclodeaminase
VLHITDEMVSDAVSIAETQQVLLEAFRSFGTNKAAMQERIRTDAGGVKLSTLGAVIPEQGFVGAKVYTTIAGQFSFAIILFSANDGRPLASLEANAITRLRTAACSVIASRYLARPASRVLALFGTGVQGRAHALQMSGAYSLNEILIVPFDDPPDMAERIAAETHVAARFTSAKEALDHADIVVTASRATTPLFTGEMLRPGTFVAAVGSSLPHTRELDDTALGRASLIAVEWRQQTLREAGDLVLASPAALPPNKIVELGELVSGTAHGRRSDNEITIYKTVGVGLEDIAIAGLAYARITGETATA